MYNSAEGREHITVLSLRKMRPHLQDWATDPDALWYTNGYGQGFTPEQAAGTVGDQFAEMTFYRDRWTNVIIESS